MGTITLGRGTFGWDYIVRADDGRDILIQTDYDYPGIASTFGWSVAMVQGARGLRNVRCSHDGTDGTIACNVGDAYASCGATASDFIASAQDFLDDHIGDTADDPGYFAPVDDLGIEYADLTQAEYASARHAALYSAGDA